LLKVALIQLQLQLDNKPEALRYLHKMLFRAAQNDADVACLPELWYPKVVKNFENEFKMIFDFAKEYGMAIVSGAFLEKFSEKLHISCPVITADGIAVGRQLKLHPYGTQKSYIEGGKNLELFDLGKFKFGVIICYDIVFPEVAGSYAKKGAELLFIPSKISKAGIKPWHMYAQVRALENRVPIAAANVCDNATSNNGKSICVDFKYESKSDIALPKLTIGSARQQTLVVDIDLKLAKKIRKRRLKDFKNDLYDFL
jgi:omega-amidase